MSSISMSSVNLPTFNGEGYEFWSIKFRAAMKGLDLWEVFEKENLEDQEPKTPGATNAEQEVSAPKAPQSREWVRKNGEALSKIFNSVGETVFPRIMNTESAKEAWLILEREYAGSKQDRVLKLQQLRRQFENLRMKEGENIQDYATRLFELINQLQALGAGITHQRVVEKILVSLPEKYDSMVSIIEQTRDLESLTPLEVIATLKAQEFRVASRQETTQEGALMAKIKPDKPITQKDKKEQGQAESKQKTKKRFPPCGICRRINHAEKDCWKKGKAKCSFCKKMGHDETRCWTKKGKELATTTEPKSAQTNLALQEEHLFMAKQEEIPKDSSLWLIDSGSTSHMTNSLEYFKTIHPEEATRVKLANGNYVKAQGRGTINVKTLAGNRSLKQVLYVPHIQHNLVSVPQLLEDDYSLLFDKRRCMISDSNGELVANIPMINKTFEISWTGGAEHALSTKVASDANLWHRRMGHCGLAMLSKLAKDRLVRDLPEILDERKSICEACQSGKMARQPFPDESQWRASDRLELIHSDLCGPMSEASLTGSLYFILIIDDATRMTWIKFLKVKSDTFKAFVEFKTEIEAEIDRKIRCLRTDNGGEFNSSEFTNYCKIHGIRRQLTAPYTPQQNGVVERKNRSVMEKVRSMLHDSGLPSKFWSEAASTAVYLMNRSLTRALADITPYEAWTGYRPSVKHLKTFGCICYYQIPSVRRTKLDMKATKGIFIGYSSKAKAYRIFDPTTKTVIISRDVLFDEESRYNLTEPGDMSRKSADLVQVLVMSRNTTASPKSGTSSQDQTSRNLMPEFESKTSTTLDETAQYENSSGPKRVRMLTSIYEKGPRMEQCNFGIDSEDPATYEDAVEFQTWRDAMQQEIDMIEKNQTWEPADLPSGKKSIGVKWIFKTKKNPDGSVNKRKARLVAKGYVQQYGIDYEETFAPVSRMETVRIILALAASKSWKLHQLDVKSAFLNGKIEEEVYVDQPQGFQDSNNPNKVLRLRKALYGLKQAPRAWYGKIDAYLLHIGFVRSENEHTLYLKRSETGVNVLVSIYVDDLIVSGNSEAEIEQFKKDMKVEFEMNDLGLLQHFLGLQVQQTDNGIFMSQQSYAQKLLEKFGLSNCNSVTTPMQTSIKLQKEDETGPADADLYRGMIGSLLYLCHSRPDLMYATSVLSRYMQKPMKSHLDAAKRILRYVKGTLYDGIMYNKSTRFEISGYSDSDWGGCIDDSRSTSGCMFLVGNSVITWSTVKQEVIAQSTTEAEYIACFEAVRQARWLRKVLVDLGEEQKEPMVIFCDNQSAIALAKNPVFHKRTKHMRLKYHVVREAEGNGEIQLRFCSSKEQKADCLTKPVPIAVLEDIRSKIGLTRISIKEETEVA